MEFRGPAQSTCGPFLCYGRVLNLELAQQLSGKQSCVLQVLSAELIEQVASEQISAALQVGKGALVQAVDPNSNAAKAGLQGTRRTLTGISSGETLPAQIRATDVLPDLAICLTSVRRVPRPQNLKVTLTNSAC